MKKNKHGLVLFSGGIDSTTALFWARGRFNQVTALSFDYGQRHRIEIKLAQKLTQKLNIPHLSLRLDLNQIGASALTDHNIPVPEMDRIEEIGPNPPPTYVPFRNGIFLSMAAAWAEANDIRDLVCGFNIVDSPHYPDTRPAFVDAMVKAINLGTKASLSPEKFTIHTPYIRMKKSEIIQKGLALNADYAYSISCYLGGEVPCGKCSSCLLRQQAWEEAGQRDPLLVRLEKEGKL